MTRVRTLAALAITVLLVVTGCSGSSERNRLVIAGIPGGLESTIRDVIFPEFRKLHPGVDLIFVPAVSSEIVAKLRASRNAPVIDVAIVELNSQEDGRNKDLWQPLTSKEIPDLGSVVRGDRAVDDSGVPLYVSPYVISYNQKYLRDHGIPVPQSWNDLANPDMTGNLAVSDINSAFGRGLLLLLNAVNGGSEDDINPGFDVYGAIARHQSTLYKTTASVEQAVADGRAGLAVWTLNRHLLMSKKMDGLKFVVPNEGTYSVTTMMSAVKNSDHTKLAEDFINFMLSDQSQRAIAEKAFFNPVTDVQLDPQTIAKLSFDNGRPISFDPVKIRENLRGWFDRFNREIAPNVGKDL